MRLKDGQKNDQKNGSPPKVEKLSELDDLPPLRDVISRYDLAAKKSLGQNYLLDLNLTMKIARSAGNLKDCTIVEIGPGPGGLTRSLIAANAEKVIAIERDIRFLPALGDISKASANRLEIIEADALELDYAALIETYNIEGPCEDCCQSSL